MQQRLLRKQQTHRNNTEQQAHSDAVIGFEVPLVLLSVLGKFRHFP